MYCFLTRQKATLHILFFNSKGSCSAWVLLTAEDSLLDVRLSENKDLYDKVVPDVK